ncbi:unnamed protein product [Urochloa humidicola]
MSRIASLYSPRHGGLQQLPRRLPVSTATASLNSSWRRRHGGRRSLPVSSGVAHKQAPRTEDPPSESGEAEQFDWLDQWYPFAPVCDLDPGAPHGKTLLGLSLVAWYDRGGGEWRVFDDACPHRLAPFSEGRIDGKGRLQCVYHGWCFDGAGGCKFIPQAPALGPPVHTSSRACVASYPCVVQNKLLWVYPRKEPEYKDVLRRKRPPYIPQIDDPSYFTEFGMRDLLYGYDVLVENIIDPSHLPYAHKGLVRGRPRSKQDPGRYVQSEKNRCISGRGAYCGFLIGCMRPWVPPCMRLESALYNILRHVGSTRSTAARHNSGSATPPVRHGLTPASLREAKTAPPSSPRDLGTFLIRSTPIAHARRAPPRSLVSRRFLSPSPRSLPPCPSLSISPISASAVAFISPTLFFLRYFSIGESG